MHSPPEQVARGPHLGGIDVRLRQHAPPQQHRNFLGVDRVVFGLAAVDGFPIQRVPEDKRYPFAGTQVGEPVPGEETFDTDDRSSR